MKYEYEVEVVYRPRSRQAWRSILVPVPQWDLDRVVSEMWTERRVTDVLVRRTA